MKATPVKVEKVKATPVKVEKVKATPVKVTTVKVVEKTPKKAVSTEGVVVKDDLKRIEGIGPKIEELLNTAGIHSFKQLSVTNVEQVKSILNAAGKRYQIHDPSTWGKQAKLAADGKWDTLDKLQGELRGGK